MSIENKRDLPAEFPLIQEIGLDIWTYISRCQFFTPNNSLDSSVATEAQSKMFRFTFFIFSIILTIELVNSRVLYLDTPRSKYYPVYPDDAGTEQASRDLDMTFFAGESGGTEEQAYPTRKTIVYPLSERFADTLGYDWDRPISYRTREFSPPRILNDEPYEMNQKIMRLNNPHKGEVILELRVIANNNNGI